MGHGNVKQCESLTGALMLIDSMYSQSGQTPSQAFGQQGVYNNMSITVSMAGGSGGVGSLTPMGPSVGMGNSNLGNISSMCNDQVGEQHVSFNPVRLEMWKVRM